MFIIFSCEEDRLVNEEITVTLQEIENHRLVNGVFVFKDRNAFEAKLDELSEKSYFELLEWNNSIGFTNSMLHHYDDLNEEFGGHTRQNLQENDPYIAIDAIAALMNNNGEIVIGNELFQTDREFSHIYTIENDEDLKSFISNYKQTEPTRDFQNIDGFNNDIQSNGRFLGEQIITFQPQGADDVFRAHLEGYSQTYGVYAAVGTKVRTERFRQGGLFGGTKWRNHDSNYIYTSGTALTKFCVVTQPGEQCTNFQLLTKSKSTSNNNNVDNIIEDGSGTGPYFFTQYIDATYQIRFLSGGTLYTQSIFFDN